MEISDAALLRRWQQRSDSDAFAELVGRHSSMVFATCNRILRNETDAEDVTQECFMELGGVRRLIGDSLGGLLHTLATHRSLDRLKGESRRREREIRYAMGRPTSCTTGWDDLSPRIDEAIANLPMKYRDAVILHFLEGQTHAEIARVSSIAEPTVRYRIQKGIERVRTDLRRQGVVVSTSAMGNALSGDRSATISASLAANLGKLSLAGAGNQAPVPTTAGSIREAFRLQKVLGVLAIVGLIGLLVWGLRHGRMPEDPELPQISERPSIVAPIGNDSDNASGVDGTENPDIESESNVLADGDDRIPDLFPEMGAPEEIVAPSGKELQPEFSQQEAVASADIEHVGDRDVAEETKVPPVEISDAVEPEEVMAQPVSEEQPKSRQEETVASADMDSTTTPDVSESGNSSPATPEPVEPPIIVAKGMESIRIELPEAFFGGTPLDYWGPNLEEPDYKARAPFLAPRGTKIVSLGKPVTASGNPTMGALQQLTDGDKHYGKTSVVELPEGLQWVQVDLEASKKLYAVLVWHFHEGNRIYFDLVAQVSDDPEFKEGVTTIYNNDYDNSAGLGVGEDKEYIESNKGRLIDAKGVKGRYVRIYGKGNTANDFTHFIEVEVWGK